jgi:hypothetical protein
MTDKIKRRPKKPGFDDFRLWLAGLNMANPILHVNGPAFTDAVLTVDFGTPLVEQRLDSDQSAELVSRLRTAAKSLYPDRDVNVHVQNDPANGIWWVNVG